MSIVLKLIEIYDILFNNIDNQIKQFDGVDVDVEVNPELFILSKGYCAKLEVLENLVSIGFLIEK